MPDALASFAAPESAGHVSSARPLSGEEESRLFWSLRGRLLRAIVAEHLNRARLRTSLILLLSAAFWGGLFVLFWEGFRFLSAGYKEMIVRQIFDVFFLSLMTMLVVSTGLILYSGLYRSPETVFLLTTPTRPERIFAHKFQEAVWFSSWGFVLLGSPMLIAYGVVAQAPWYYFATLPAFVIAFVLIPAACGAIFCLLLVYYLPTWRLHILTVTATVLVSLVVWLGWSIVSAGEHDLHEPRLWLNGILSRLEFVEQRWLPSWWLTEGLLEASEPMDAGAGDYQPAAQAMLYLALLVSNAMFFQLLATMTAKRFYRESFGQLQGERIHKRRSGASWIDRLAARATALLMLPAQIRLLIIKDLRLFRRDPVQWSQFLIFFGLLSLYFFNIRRFAHDEHLLEWMGMIGFLNLAVVGLILSTFTTRFIFPMISLEGRRFWILGRLPLDRDKILWSKFVFACAGSMAPCMTLILISDLMLRVHTLMLVVHQLTCVELCLGLSAIAVGLGAALPDLRENSPSKVAAGFGGTLNLVVSAVFILLLTTSSAIVCHYLRGPNSDTGLPSWIELIGARTALFVSLLLIFALGALAACIPLRIGFRKFREMEF